MKIILQGAGSSATVWAANENGVIVGSLQVRERELPYGRTSSVHYAEIVSLEVDKSARRGGVGTALVERAMRWAAEHGYERVAVESTARSDRPGPPFYAALGFEQRSIIWDIATEGWTS